MKGRLLLAAGSVLFAGLYGVIPVRADELLRFKSGYEMMVLSHREEKGMIIVTLDGGGEVGFPKNVLELLEEGKPTSRTGPTPHNRVLSRVPQMDFFQSRYVSTGQRALKGSAVSGNMVRVGYSMSGDGQLRFGQGPQGEMYGNKIGTDIRQRGHGPAAPESQTPAPRGAKVGTPTAEADLEAQ
jgi:hypothetical protein